MTFAAVPPASNEPASARGRLSAFARGVLATDGCTRALLAAWILSRLAVVLVLWRAPFVDDALDYHQMAVALLRGGRFEPDWPPGLPIYLACWYRLFGAAPPIGRLAVCVLAVAFAFILVRLLRRLGGTLAANVGLLLLLFAPSHLYFAATPLTQLPAALLLVGILLAITAAFDRPTPWRWSLVGLLLGASVLVRPSNVLLAGAMPLYLAYRTRRLSAWLLPMLVMSLLIGVWTVKARELSGRFIFINNANSQNLFYGNNADTPLYRTWWFGSHKRGEPGVPAHYVAEFDRIARLPAADRDHEFSRVALDHIEARPDLFLVRSLSRVRTFFAFDTFTAAQIRKHADLKRLGLFVLVVDGAGYLLVVALGLVWLCGGAQPAGAERRAGLIAAALVLLYAIPYFASFSHPSYHFPIVPLLAVLAALVVARWRETGLLLPTSRRARVALFACWGVLALIQLEWIANMSSRL